MRKICLSDLPKYVRNEEIDWNKSIGYKVKFIYDDIEGEVEIIDYNNSILYIKYQNKELFEISRRNFKKCALGKLLGKKTDEFKVKIGQVFKDNKRDLVIMDKKYMKNKNGQNHKWYKYTCNKCGWTEGWIIEHSLLNGVGCSCCSGLTVVEEINSIVANKETRWMISYFQGGYDEAKLYTRTSNKKITPICPDCGKIKDKEITINHIYIDKSIGCTCGDGVSYPEKFMFSVLEQLEINFKTQFSPDWIKPKRYDFYFELENNKYILEMDGELGHGKKTHSLSKKSAEETKQDDEYKDFMAREHNIEVIRIDSTVSELEFIKNNILNSKLNEILDLHTIDWNKCEEFSLKNRVKEACEYKKNNPDYSAKDIAVIMNMNCGTISKYLKQGSKLGWCNYNPKDESFKGRSKSGKMNGKQVEIFKDGVSLGVFYSCSELERESKRLFGVKLWQTAICEVCRNARIQHKGFTFKFNKQQTKE